MARNLAPDAIPTDWTYDLLDNFAERRSGHTPSKSFPEYWNGGVKWISLADSHRLDKGYVYVTDNEISNEGLKNSSAELHPAETVVLSRDAGIGKSGVMAAPMAVSQHFIAWRCDNKSKIHSWYLYNWLQLHKAEFERQAVGSTIKTIGLPYFKKLKMAAPKFAEQKKIAQILSTWDKAITTSEQLLANSQQQKKALMQQLLTGKKRLMDKNGVKFSEEWKEVKISSRCEVRRGASPRPINDSKWFSDHGRGWIRISDVTASHTDKLLKTTQHLSDLGVKNSVSVDPGDLIMSICGTIGVPKFIGIPACIHDGFVIFRECSDNLELNFLYHYLNYISEKLASGGQPGTQKNLNTGIVGNTLMPLISNEEQQKIASTLSAADREIETLQQQLAHLKQEKKALMQQLLTGKRRVKLEDAA